MSIIKILPEHKSNTTIQFAPKRVFSSGSGGYTGSLNVIVNRSHTQKDSIDMREGLTNQEGPQKFSENTFEGRREMIYNARFNTVGQGNIFSEEKVPYNYELQLALLMDGANPVDEDENGVFDDFSNFPPEFFKKRYVQLNLNAAHSGYSDLPMHPRNAYQLVVSRSVPGTNYLHPAYRKKEIIRNILDPHYQVGRPGLGWGYANFSSINFFESNSIEIPAIVYDSTGDLYKPTKDIHVDFKLKVNYHPTDAGTILHLPGVFAVSVVTGSSVDEYNNPSHYKLLFQMGTDSSGSIQPNTVDLGVANSARGNTQIYQSLENITASYWHHCSIRYSDTNNARTGSFYIDGVPSGEFIPTSSFTVASGLSQNRDVLCIGGFYTGSSSASKSFFGQTAATDQGIKETSIRPAATATFTLSDKPNEETTITLSDAEGTSVIFEVDGSNDGAVTEPPEGSEVVALNGITGAGGGAAGTIADLVAKINAHGIKITAVATTSTRITLTQQITGLAGNRAISLSNASNWNSVSSVNVPLAFSGGGFLAPTNHFSNPFCGEVHELKISNFAPGKRKIRKLVTTPATSSVDLLFHLPVLYTPDAPVNFYNAMLGDLFDEAGSVTARTSLKDFYDEFPVQISRRFDAPFNTHHANIGGFVNINAQSFLMDFANGNYPYLHNLADNLQAHSSCHELSSSFSLFDVHQRRNTVIMPCDDGNFVRTYDVYSGSHLTGSIVKADRPGVLRLDNMGDFTTNYDSKLALVDEAYSYTLPQEDPEDQGPTGTTRRVSSAKPSQSSSLPAQRFFDPDGHGLITGAELGSSLISIFSIPTLFYGNRLRPHSIKMTSNLYRGGGSIVGSGMNKRFERGHDYRMEVNLCDDGYGNIIRCDTSGSVSQKSIVGSVYYEDGIIALKSPHMFSFGEHNYTLDFEGEQNTHILELLVPVGRNQFNSSSNPNYNAFKPLADANEEAESFIYLSTLNFHDTNLNVVAKARFAQPIIKRVNDRYMVRVKFDF